MCTMAINNELNGIELVFEARPAKEILESIKAAGFRWHNLKKLWYAKKTPERMALAEKLSGGTAPVAAPAATAPKEIISKYGIKVGDILEDSWGYEQTNVEFYKVTKIVSPCKIEIVEVGHSRSNYESHGMACDVVPDVNNEIGERIVKTVAQDSWEKQDGRYHIKINSCVSLTPWNGQPCYCSWYY